MLDSAKAQKYGITAQLDSRHPQLQMADSPWKMYEADIDAMACEKKCVSKCLTQPGIMQPSLNCTPPLGQQWSSLATHFLLHFCWQAQQLHKLMIPPILLQQCFHPGLIRGSWLLDVVVARSYLCSCAIFHVHHALPQLQQCRCESVEAVLTHI